MKPLALYLLFSIPINIGVLNYIGKNWAELLLIMMIPILLEVVRFVMVKIVKLRRDIGVIFNLVVEAVKFLIVVVALFVFVSPLKSENMCTSIMFCVNFFVAQFVGVYVMSRLL